MNSSLLFLVLAGLMATAYATNCYECSILESTCNDGDDAYSKPSSHEQDCTVYGDGDGLGNYENGGCYKYKLRTKLFGTWTETTDRSCGTDESDDNSDCAVPISVDLFGIETETFYCSCSGDLCNSGSQVSFSVALCLAALTKLFL